jgi:hypothetical protein
MVHHQISLALSDYIKLQPFKYYSVNVINFLGFNTGGYFFAFQIWLFFEDSTLATITSNKQFFLWR